MMREFFFETTPESNQANEISMTVLRVFVGLAMALEHGRGKMPPPAKFVSGVEDMGFPLPELFAWAAGLSEFAGGILLALGLLTRPSAVFIAITMAVAGLVRHAEDPFKTKELSFLYLAVALAFVARGASRYSLDRFFEAKGSAKTPKSSKPKDNKSKGKK